MGGEKGGEVIGNEVDLPDQANFGNAAISPEPVLLYNFNYIWANTNVLDLVMENTVKIMHELFPNFNILSIWSTVVKLTLQFKFSLFRLTLQNNVLY